MTQTQTRPLAADGDPAGALSLEALRGLQTSFRAQPAYRLAQNAVTRHSVDDIALDHRVVFAADHTFSTALDDWAVTDQKQTGRCWMFAGLNLLRFAARRSLGVKEFEFSQNYLMFWDKVERANYFLEAIIESADRDVTDRSVAFLLDGPLSDGGQWNMFINLVRKHGLVPKALMPETDSSSHSRRMNAVLRSKLREGARTLRTMHSRGASLDELRACKAQYVAVVHRILNIHLGTPPERFTFQWRDKDGAFHRTDEVTAREFAARFVDLPLDSYVCLVHDPRTANPPGRTYTVEYLGNVVGGQRVTYLNVDMDVMKGIAQRTLEAGEPVWFGCDVGKQMRRDLGLMDRDLLDLGPVYDTSFDLTKVERLEYGESQMTHAMLFTGVDVVDDVPRRWRVENSWGAEPGQKGFFTMNDAWFDEYMFEIAARKEYLPRDLQEALELEPTVLPPWDPMGALAR
ncbi:MAG TPA: C1 family peptidase [Chloroflexota bacterium]|nr:C1 family peptidase [Chloroflexota bacterium]